MGKITCSRHRSRFARRLLSGALACLMLLSAAGGAALAAGGTKNTVSRTIAIVYDNSGSMYTSQNMAWCRAMYAIEVFASMMNDGDTLQIYPMYELTANNRSYTSQDPFTVSGGGDISAIRELFTPQAGDTPIETIGDAYAGLQKSGSTEKWLIVLTDGNEFYENLVGLGNGTKARLEEVLTQYNRDVNVLYLGIGGVAVMPEVTGGAHQYYADKAANSADVLSKLTEMCNMIFGRDELASAGNQLSFDVSMKKMILFVQGSDIADVSLRDASGASVGSPSVEYSPRYSEQGAGNYSNFGIDRSLSGMIAVYDTELDAGTYTLSYSGSASNVSVYYEPDVDLTATLTDEYGAAVTPSAELYPGTYTMNYGLVDKDGGMTTSNLLGRTHYDVTYRVGEEEKTASSDESGQIALELNEGDVLDGEITATYLSGYTITKSFSDFGWPAGGFHVVPRPAGTLELRAAGGQETFPLSGLEQTPYTVTLLFEGAPLTGAQLDAAELSASVEGGNAGCEVLREGDGYTVSLRYAGTAADTACGDYVLHLSGSYTDEFGVTSQSAPVDIPFAVEDDGSALSMEVDGPGYYVISKLADSEGILVSLKMDGEELTDEQLAQTALSVDGDGLNCTAEPLYGQSAYRVRIAPDDGARPGRYSLHFTASALDQVGRTTTAEEGKRVELSRYPLWLKFLVAALILALIAALIILYLNMKVLPKKITVNRAQTVFIVDGEVVEGTTSCKYTGGGKKKGSLQITTPHYSGSPLIKGGFTLNLEAVSPRRMKSSRRRVRVTRVAPANTPALQSLQIGNHTLTKTEEDGVVWLFDGKQVPGASVTTGFEMGGKPNCTYVGAPQTGEDFTLKVVLQYK